MALGGVPAVVWYLSSTDLLFEENAEMPMAFEKDFGMEYPALFFVDPNNENFLYMVCIKQLLGACIYWLVSCTRARLH